MNRHIIIIVIIYCSNPAALMCWFCSDKEIRRGGGRGEAGEQVAQAEEEEK